MATQGTVHYDKVLTDLSVSFAEELGRDLIATKLFPLVTVNERSGRYPVFDREAFKVVVGEDTLSGTGRAKLFEPKRSSDTYYVDGHGEYVIESRYDRAAADPAFEVQVTEQMPTLIQRQEMRLELAISTLLLTSGNYPAANKLALDGIADRCWDETKPTPMADIWALLRNGSLQCGVPLNTLAFPSVLFELWREMADVRAALKGDKGGRVDARDVADYFGLDNVWVPKGLYDTTKKGLAASNDFFWTGDSVVGLYVPRIPGRKVPSTGYTFTWFPREVPVGVGRDGRVVGTWWEPGRGGAGGSDLAEVDFFYDQKLTGRDSNGKILSGYLLYDILHSS